MSDFDIPSSAELRHEMRVEVVRFRAEVERLQAENERLRRCLAKQPNTYMIAYEDGTHERLARAACELQDKLAARDEEVERLRAALEPFAKRFKAVVIQGHLSGHMTEDDEMYVKVKHLEAAYSLLAALTGQKEET